MRQRTASKRRRGDAQHLRDTASCTARAERAPRTTHASTLNPAIYTISRLITLRSFAGQKAQKIPKQCGFAGISRKHSGAKIRYASTAMCAHTRRLRRSSDRRSLPRTRLPRVCVRRANGVAVMPRISATLRAAPREQSPRHELYTPAHSIPQIYTLPRLITSVFAKATPRQAALLCRAKSPKIPKRCGFARHIAQA